nr:MAG TPA_asm: hypothetical protein [Caudoviricetes sp.]
MQDKVIYGAKHNMVNESFYLEIMNLINSKTEGQYGILKENPLKTIKH